MKPLPLEKAAQRERRKAEKAATLVTNSEKVCVICSLPFTGYGHNPEPVKKFSEGRACDICNDTVVVQVRIRQGQYMQKQKGE